MGEIVVVRRRVNTYGLAPIGLSHSHSKSDQNSFANSSTQLFTVYGICIFFVLLTFLHNVVCAFQLYCF